MNNTNNNNIDSLYNDSGERKKDFGNQLSIAMLSIIAAALSLGPNNNSSSN